jgi:hypothetical protein
MPVDWTGHQPYPSISSPTLKYTTQREGWGGGPATAHLLAMAVTLRKYYCSDLLALFTVPSHVIMPSPSSTDHEAAIGVVTG